MLREHFCQRIMQLNHMMRWFLQTTFLTCLSIAPVYANYQALCDLPTLYPKYLQWKEDTFAPYNFNWKGSIYFNASRSGVQGERFLLNEQLSNVKLAFDWQLRPELKFHGLFIYNTLPTPINPSFYFEQAYFLAALSSAQLEIGKQWIGFGNYKSDLIYKPLAKALGQTNEYAVQIGWMKDWYAKLGLFPPYSQITGMESPLYYNVNVGRVGVWQSINYNVGASVLNSFADTQLMQYNKGFGGFLFKTLESKVPGFAAYTNFEWQNMSAYFTFVTALTQFRRNELSYQSHGAKPAALSLQVGRLINLYTIPTKLIVFYDYSWQSLALQLPAQRIGVGINFYPSKCFDLQFQFFKDYAYASNVVATGLNESVQGTSTVANTMALQLVVYF